MTTISLVTLDAIQAAAAALKGVARVTPIVPLSTDPALQHISLKCENLQTAGAFKLRGAYNLMVRLAPEVRARGVVTYSSGNHGQAVAYAARLLGTSAVIVMPTTAPAIKIEGARALGAEVQFAGTVTTDRRAVAERLERERGLVMVPPFDHPDIIAGQGTVGLEILAQEPSATTVYVPVGGGGLIAGVAAAIKALHPGVRIVGVEPVGAPKMTRSLEAGTPATLEHVESIADGLLAVRPGDLTFEHVRQLVDEVVLVSEEEIAGSVAVLQREAKLVAEPSGAASVAAVRRLAPPGTPGVHVAIVSGGNVSPERLAEFLAGSGGDS